MGKDTGTKVAGAIKFAEKVLLVVIALLTVFATLEEIWQIYLNGSVQLADLLLLFIFTEVLGMIGIFFVSNRIPITLPIFIAMTAIARLIILQGKEMDPSALVYQSAAILLIAVAIVVMRLRHSKKLGIETKSKKK